MTTAYDLRPVCADDEAFLLQLYRETRDDLVGAGLDAETTARLVELQAAAQRLDYERRFPDAQHDIVLVDGMPVGRIWVDRRADEIRLLDIAVSAAARNRGVGTALLRDLIDEAATAGVALRHFVLVENEAAIRLYTRLGFSVVDQHGMHLLMEYQQITHD